MHQLFVLHTDLLTSWIFPVSCMQAKMLNHLAAYSGETGTMLINW